MKILIAEDDPVSCEVLATVLTQLGHDVDVTRDGDAAAAQLLSSEAPPLAILDWMMPGRTGPEVCAQVRASGQPRMPYLILLTARGGAENIAGGLKSGADDYIVKPFDPDELEARVGVGIRMLRMQTALADQVEELQAALRQVKQLRGLLPICAWCKKVRDDRNYWQQVETYISAHTDAQFTHSMCPDCFEKTLQEM
ncbi:MAG: response regulator transcription factor [Planctomycetia bacterium]|nr:response regulator transcription factor [Planctomycetia bacterium]